MINFISAVMIGLAMALLISKDARDLFDKFRKD